jgi:hypothetical protein
VLGALIGALIHRVIDGLARAWIRRGRDIGDASGPAR